MKKLFFLTILLLLKGSLLFSQVAISLDGSVPHASAVLDLQSANQGLLLPRVTTTQQKNIDEPASGLVIYNLDSNDVYFYNGSYWLSVRNLTDTIQKWSCGDSLIDIRDMQVYATVQIGAQCWMAENLNVGTMINGSQDQTNNGIIEKYCYDDNASNCDTYGGLYQWDEMMQYTTQEGTQGICPDGWYIPTDAEWTTMTTYVSSIPDYQCDNNSSYIAKSLAATANWNTHSGTCAVGNNLAANNATSFTALPGGYRYFSNGSFYSLGGYGRQWSSTESISSYAFGRCLLFNAATVYKFGNSEKTDGRSVRCLKD